MEANAWLFSNLIAKKPNKSRIWVRAGNIHPHIYSPAYSIDCPAATPEAQAHWKL